MKVKSILEEEEAIDKEVRYINSWEIPQSSSSKEGESAWGIVAISHYLLSFTSCCLYPHPSLKLLT